jgi:predicted RNA-binding protein
MQSNRFIRTAAIGVLCAVVGTAAGIAGSSAATSSKSSSKSSRASHAGRPAGPFRLGGGPPVHSEAVVLNKAGDKFITVTTDAGTVKSVSGDQLTITEGTKNLTYKDVTVTVSSDATVYRNGAKAALSDLQAGDHVLVSQSSEGTFVGAFDSEHRPPHPGGPRSGPPPGPPPAG